MIISFTDSGLEDCWREGKCQKVSSELQRRTLRKLDMMDAATCLEDLRYPPGNDLHPLKGKYGGYWAIRVNGPWRLIFTFEENGCFIDRIELIQYH